MILHLSRRSHGQAPHLCLHATAFCHLLRTRPTYSRACGCSHVPAGLWKRLINTLRSLPTTLETITRGTWYAAFVPQYFDVSSNIFSLYATVIVPSCVLPCEHRKVLRMLFKLTSVMPSTKPESRSVPWFQSWTMVSATSRRR